MKDTRSAKKSGLAKKGGAAKKPGSAKNADPDNKPNVKDPLPIRSLDFLGGMASADGWRPDSVMPEIAFAGRSNVGKSSLINTLLRRRSFVRVSRTPGRTREINFFSVNNEFVLADLPGYGYAKIAKSRKAEWRPLIEGYLAKSPKLRGVVQLLDVRHKPTEDDRQMLDFLASLEIPTLIAVTKVDKLSKKAALEHILLMAESLHLDTDQMIPFSSNTGAGRFELAEALMELVRSEDEAAPADDEGVTEEE